MAKTKKPKTIKPKGEPGRPTLFTEETKKKILSHLEDGLPRKLACNLVGMHHETLRVHLKKDLDFLAEIEQSQAIGTRKLHFLVLQQKGAWKILKNVAPDIYKEHIEISYDESKPITIHSLDDDSEAI